MSVEYKQVVSVEPKTIAVGDRVLFTNPSTGQQLIGTVLSPHCQCDACRKWTVEFDSYMFREVNTRTAHVEDEYLIPLQRMTMPKQHDPLCRAAPYRDAAQISKDDGVAWCQCDLIAKADERGATRALDKARQLITALACPITIAEGHCEECEQYREALACIESLRGDS